MSLRSTRKKSTADLVFDQLARRILDGTWAPGAPLPPEREIAEQCHCSRIVARQAVHRLAELGLVRNHQGGATRVLDPSKADSRVAVLSMQLGIGSWDRELEEQTLLWGIAPLALASTRASAEARAELARIARDAPSESLEQDFWSSLAEASGNRLYSMDLRLWDRAAPPPEAASDEDRASYVKLARLLVEGRDPVPFYLSIVDKLL